MTATLEHNGMDIEANGNDNGPAKPSASGRQVRLRINDREMETKYANAFRSNASHDELMLDFGINTVVSGRHDAEVESQSEIRFDVHSRTIMNYYTAKRLAMLLGNLVREHEGKFGEIKLNVADRSKVDAAGRR